MADTIALMRKRVLDMAIRGELVDQRPEEGSAEELILSFKKENKLKEINKDEIPYTIPQSWLWVDFESIIKSIGTKNNQIKSKEIENTGTIPVVSQGKEYIDGFSNQVDKSISPKKPVILFGDHTRNVKYIDFEFIIGADGTKIFESLLADSKYLFRWVQHASTFIENRGYSRHYSLLKKIPVPIPPLAEQKRIVAKIEDIFAVIDQIGTKKEEALSIIRKMRQTALQDAIMGVLVDQEDEDEPASILYEKIQAEKEKLVKEKKMKKEKPLPEIEVGEIPFDIPESWKWVRLGNVIYLISGRDLATNEFNYENKGLPYITGASNFNNGELVINRWVENPKVISKLDDLLITVKGTVGEMLFQKEEKAHIARQVMAIRKASRTNLKFIKYFLDAELTKLKDRAKSMIPGVSREDILHFEFPMPPLVEQERIVDKLDEIMEICDQMEAIFDGTSEMNMNLNVI
ncbi:restriction endonuclease subunit S [Aerococcus urinaeequi]|uniref:restriction endonuclease subunit S n=1 Tax=Aerococcus urinaeequi TaxID=51665 RepID=UPI003D6AA075